MNQDVLTERRGPVLVITLNRPRTGNAFDRAMLGELARAFDLLETGSDLAAGVVTGTGRDFCVGADLRAGEEALRDMVLDVGSGVLGREVSKPLVAAVEGYALGGGLELCLACDLVVAARDARLGLPEVRHGGIAAGGALLTLPRRVPYQIAAELALTGDIRPAEFFARWGLVNEVVDPGTSLTRAMDVAGRICGNSAIATSATKRILQQSTAWPPGEAWERQRAHVEPVLRSAGFTEGLRAFVEKREGMSPA
ncbi:enoyl-CoA hydratase-related protein [Saccharomonospora sp. NPDC046836]|uniref:enoyl-CoA hydratase-related protein n=1 Tax=Saccharomonospora sp. NPDC046836 TaxID=3156921 RepID=UPI0033ED1204